MKKIFFDTSVLVSALLEHHSRHQASFRWLLEAKEKKIHAVIATHTLAELYAVLTRYPIKPPIPPQTALEIIQDTIVPFFTIIGLNKKDYVDTLARVARFARQGGAIYDALLLTAAHKSKADTVLTLNLKHFVGYEPDLDQKLREP